MGLLLLFFSTPTKKNKKELYLWIGGINIGGKRFEDRDSSKKGVVRMLSSNVKNHFGNTVKY